MCTASDSHGGMLKPPDRAQRICGPDRRRRPVHSITPPPASARQVGPSATKICGKASELMGCLRRPVHSITPPLLPLHGRLDPRQQQLGGKLRSWWVVAGDLYTRFPPPPPCLCTAGWALVKEMSGGASDWWVVGILYMYILYFQLSSIQFQSRSIQFRSIHFSSFQFNSVQFSSIQFRPIQLSSIQLFS
jgi:hypothetical protein